MEKIEVIFRPDENVAVLRVEKGAKLLVRNGKMDASLRPFVFQKASMNGFHFIQFSTGALLTARGYDPAFGTCLEVCFTREDRPGEHPSLPVNAISFPRLRVALWKAGRRPRPLEEHIPFKNLELVVLDDSNKKGEKPMLSVNATFRGWTVKRSEVESLLKSLPSRPRPAAETKSAEKTTA